MPQKKIRIDGYMFVANVIELLQKCPERTMNIDLLYESLHIKVTEQTESLLTEHPSIHVSRNNVGFVPFKSVGNQLEIIQLLMTSFPRCHRISDFIGIYSYICADIDELLFSGRCIMVDDVNKAITVKPLKQFAFSDRVKQLWYRHVNTEI